MHTRVAALMMLRRSATSANHKRLSRLCLTSQHHPAAAIRQGSRSALRDSRLCQAVVRRLEKILACVSTPRPSSPRCRTGQVASGAGRSAIGGDTHTVPA